MKYQYRCLKCGHTLEREELVSDHMERRIESCSACGGAMAQQPTEPRQV